MFSANSEQIKTIVESSFALFNVPPSGQVTVWLDVVNINVSLKSNVRLVVVARIMRPLSYRLRARTQTSVDIMY